MKCEDCCHAEMCKWIDELEGRGCDFLSQGQISLNDINNAIEASFRNGVRSAKVEQEPCDDAISRILKKMWNCRGKHTTSIDKVAMEQIIRDELPSVTPSRRKGHWIREVDFGNCLHYVCSECENEGENSDYCPYCGAEMESAKWQEMKSK